MKKHLPLLFVYISVGIACSSKAQISNTKSILTDKKATTETKTLYQNLHKTTSLICIRDFQKAIR
nr:hypothetical protein [uncultured Flavobacterium sp.]